MLQCLLQKQQSVITLSQLFYIILLDICSLLVLVGSDLDFVMQQSVTFDLGSASGNTISLDVMVLDDLLVEGTESFTLSGRVESGSSGAVFSQATLTIPILDNDGTFYPFCISDPFSVLVHLKL